MAKDRRKKSTLSLSTEEQNQNHYKLCGFLHATLAVKTTTLPAPGDSLLNPFEKKSINTCSSLDLCVLRTGKGAELVPVDFLSAAETPVSSGKKKRRVVGGVKGSRSIVRCLQALAAKNCVQIQGLVIAVARRGEETRALVLFDVYLPLELWSDPQCWKSGPAAAAVLSHLSCDWENRGKSISTTTGNESSLLQNEQRIWIVPECHVFGCSSHSNLTESDKSTMFDLHEIFKSLPVLDDGGKGYDTFIKLAKPSNVTAISDVPNEILISILNKLMPKDLLSVSITCQHLRALAVSVMPCINVKLFSHQQIAVEWMLKRENNSKSLAHPLFSDMLTEDGFQYFFNVITGEVFPGKSPTVPDFKGGMFCDEPGLGKTVTALSLILKTKGKLAAPPEGVELKWCDLNSGERYAYYEISATCKKHLASNVWHGQSYINFDHQEKASALVSESPFSTPPPKRMKWSLSPSNTKPASVGSDNLILTSCNSEPLLLSEHRVRCTRSISRIKRSLYEPCVSSKQKTSKGRPRGSRNSKTIIKVLPQRSSSRGKCKNAEKNSGIAVETNEWVQCDACNKWRKLPPSAERPDDNVAWFCSMNTDVLRQDCSAAQECWDKRVKITCLPGFYSVGSQPGQEQNVTFFTDVLKAHAYLLNKETRDALSWLSNLTADKLTKMESVGITLPPGLTMTSIFGKDNHGYDSIFGAFGLIQRKEGKGLTRWHYPSGLENLTFDVEALKIALTKPVDIVRVYLSRATLIIVPQNLVDHWKNQLKKHVRDNQVRVFVWVDNKKPVVAHRLAWDYDIVITTFSRLSVEWTPQADSVLLQVHWLRVILDEGHTLGSSVSLTNKLQLAISLTASSRWLLTGTPTPNTPNSQVSHLHPMLKFLHEEVYGLNSKAWESGVLRPFETEMEDGRTRLLQLLRRCMISARKADLKIIPPCIKRNIFLDFTKEHARTYNELVETVRRNILMADWNDPSHVESLLNPKQWKFRSTTIRNVRLSCCVAGHIKVRNAGEDIQETMEMLTQQGLEPSSEEYVLIKNGLISGGNCNRCQEWCRLPVITPCMHLLCLACVSLDSRKCSLPGCGHGYKMQNPESRARPENPNPKWPVPQDLIELQPSYNQDDWNPDWHATSSSKVAYLVERLKKLQTGDTNLPEKVIIFSQFLEHIHVVEGQLTTAGIKFAGMYSPMYHVNKVKSLTMFQKDDSCMALIMDGSGALGLDLSFVTYVFLMEPIWDRSMEEQVISRAHRMGATRPINVETLAMRGTIEEQMLEFLQDPLQCRKALKEDTGTLNQEGQKAHRSLHDFAESNYLAKLGFVRTKTNN